MEKTELMKEIDNAIDAVMQENRPWDMTRAEQQSLRLATAPALSENERAGRVCDMLTTFGMQSQPRFDGLYSLVRDIAE